MPQNQYGYDPYNMGGMFNTSQNYKYTPPPASYGKKMRPITDPNYQQYKQNIADLQTRLAQGKYDSGQYQEFQGKISDYQKQIRDMETAATYYEYPDPSQYASSDLINQYFDIAGRNLSSREANTRGLAQRDAAALAGGRNFLSSGNLISNVGNEAVAPYAGTFGQLEGQRAGAQQSLQRWLANAMNAKTSAETGNEAGWTQLQGMLGQQDTQNAITRSNLAQEYSTANSPGAFDYFNILLKYFPSILDLFKGKNTGQNTDQQNFNGGSSTNFDTGSGYSNG